MRHITNTQKDTLEELDISISKKYTFSFTSYNLDRISKLQNLKVLKLNNNNISTGLFIQLLQLKNLEVLEIDGNLKSTSLEAVIVPDPSNFP